MPAIPALRGLKQEDREFKTSLGYIYIETAPFCLLACSMGPVNMMAQYGYVSREREKNSRKLQI